MMQRVREYQELFNQLFGFARLPEILREYAAYVDWQRKLIGRLRRHPYDPFIHYLVALIHLVGRIEKLQREMDRIRTLDANGLQCP